MRHRISLRFDILHSFLWHFYAFQVHWETGELVSWWLANKNIILFSLCLIFSSCFILPLYACVVEIFHLDHKWTLYPANLKWFLLNSQSYPFTIIIVFNIIVFRPNGDILIDKLDLENGTPWEIKKGMNKYIFIRNIGDLRLV